MQHQRKFLSPASAVSAARNAAHPIGVSVAGVQPIRAGDNWVAVLRVYDAPDELSRRDIERLAPFRIEHVEKPPPIEDEDYELEDEEKPIFAEDGSLLHGALSRIIRIHFSEHPEHDNEQVYQHLLTLGVDRRSVSVGPTLANIRREMGLPRPQRAKVEKPVKVEKLAIPVRPPRVTRRDVARQLLQDFPDETTEQLLARGAASGFSKTQLQHSLWHMRSEMGRTKTKNSHIVRVQATVRPPWL